MEYLEQLQETLWFSLIANNIDFDEKKMLQQIF